MNRPHHQPHAAKTSPEYWEAAWRAANLPDPLDPRGGSHLFFLLHRHFQRFIKINVLPGDSLVEIGCGSSRWLPYFQREFGLSVSGIDYSPLGCANARQILERAGIDGDIAQGDMFSPPPGWREQFNVAVSFGLVEHFHDTADAVTGCAAYLCQGGLMFTLVPTMRGLYGLAYRLLNRRVYDAHLPLTREQLAEAHQRAGLEVLECSYLLGLPGVLGETSPTDRLHRAHAIIRRISRGYWWLERHGLGIPPNRYTSPYA